MVVENKILSCFFTRLSLCSTIYLLYLLLLEYDIYFSFFFYIILIIATIIYYHRASYTGLAPTYFILAYREILY